MHHQSLHQALSRRFTPRHFSLLFSVCALFATSFTPQIARAELPPQVYQEAYNAAPEFLEIEISRVALRERLSPEKKTISVFSDAIVTKVERSKSGLKVGDKISLRYLTSEYLTPGWVGPSSNLVLEKGVIYRAYLKKAGSHYYIAGLGRSFQTVTAGT